jgi:hypothetical protein
LPEVIRTCSRATKLFGCFYAGSPIPCAIETYLESLGRMRPWGKPSTASTSSDGGVLENSLAFSRPSLRILLGCYQEPLRAQSDTVGFSDGAVRSMCRPGDAAGTTDVQRRVYSGHKREISRRTCSRCYEYGPSRTRTWTPTRLFSPESAINKRMALVHQNQQPQFVIRRCRISTSISHHIWTHRC